VSEILFRPLSAETSAWLAAQPSVEVGLRANPHFPDYLKPVFFSPAFLLALRHVVSALRSEDASLLDPLDFTTTQAPRVVSVRHARRLAGLFRYLDPKEVREALQAGPLTGVDNKAVNTPLNALRRCFADCGLQGHGVLLMEGKAPEKKLSKTDLLEQEIERLRAILARHGLDPDGE